MTAGSDPLRPLAGVRVLDLTSNAAGPYATWLLASLGADVIKVESQSRVDPSRGSANRPYRRSVFYEDINGGKRCVTLDLKEPADAEAALALAASCHAVVDSYRPGVMARLGLGFDVLHERAPHLVVASFSATGETGPLAGLPGYAGVFNALGGLGGITGYVDGPPTELRTSIDLRAGAMFAMSIAAALVEARRTGEGRRVDFSAVEAVALLAGEHVAAHRLGADTELRVGNMDELWAPHGVYPATDGRWVAVAVRSDAEWATVAEEITRAGITVPPGFETAQVRRERAVEVDALMSRWTRASDAKAATDALAVRGVPAEVVLDAADVLADKHLAERDLFHPVPLFDGGGSAMVAAAPWLIDGRRPPVGTPRDLGADHEAVMKELVEGPAPAVRSERARPLRVLELGCGAAAPFAGRTLVALGAEVVKVELGPEGDWARRRPPVVEVGGTRAGVLYHHLNAGKSVELVDADELSARLDERWRWADAVLMDEHFLAVPEVADRLRRPGPQLVVCVTPFGLSGPDAGRPGTAGTVFARCGECSITPGGSVYQQHPDEPPLLARGKLADFDAGVAAALLVLAEQVRAEAGDGPLVADVSTYEVAVSLNRWLPSNVDRSQFVETRATSAYPYGGLQACLDGHAMFLPSTDRHWQSLVEVMGRPEWAARPEYATYEGRTGGAAEIRAGIAAWAATQARDQLLQLGLRHGVPIGPYRSAEEVARCGHLEGRGFFVPYAGEWSLPGLPAPGLMSRTALTVAPALGSDGGPPQRKDDR